MQLNSKPVIFAIVSSLLFFAFAIFMFISKFLPQISFPIAILTLIVFIATLIKTDVAIIILIFSMLLSPELSIGQIPERSVMLRLDDILLIIIFFTWLFKMAINKQLGLLRNTPINLPIASYTLVYFLATGLGIIDGKIYAIQSSFYLLKYIEYFMLYFMVSNIVKDKKQIRTFILAILITCVIVCSYANFTLGKFGRATAPFEGAGEANTLGAYLMLLFAIAMGLFLYSTSIRQRLWLGILLPFIFITFLNTLSRGSYIAFIFMYLSLIILSKKKYLLIITLILSVCFFPFILPNKVTERISSTFIPGKLYRPLGQPITLDESASARIENFRSVLEKWKNRPILGYGATGVGFTDIQYARILGEVGIIGLWIFTWLIFAVFKHGFFTLRAVEDGWAKGLTLGFLAALIGLLVHSFSASTFIIIRVMEPFWFLAAVILLLPRLSDDSAKKFLGSKV